MKGKLISKLIAGAVLLTAPIGLIACGKDKGKTDPATTVAKSEIVNFDNTYYVGDKVNLNDVTLKLTMGNGSVLEFPISSSMVTLPDMSTPGEKTIKITYNGKTYEFKINVSQKPDILQHINNFINHYKNSNGVNKVNISSTMNLDTAFLNEKEHISEELFNKTLTKQDVAEMDELLEGVYSVVANGIFESALDLEADDVLNSTDWKTKLNAVKAITKIYENAKNYDLVTYVLKHLFPEAGNVNYSTYITNNIADSMSLSLTGKSKLKQLLDTAFNDLRAYEFNAFEFVDNFNQIVQNYSSDADIKGFVSDAKTASDNLQAGNKNTLSIFLNEIKEYFPEMFCNVYEDWDVRGDQEYFTALEQAKANNLELEYATNFIALIKAIEDFDFNNSLASVNAIEAKLTALENTINKVNTQITRAKYVGVLLEQDIVMLKEILSKYTGDLVLDIINTVKEFAGLDDMLNGIVPEGTSNTVDFAVETFRTSVLGGEGFSKQTYKDFVDAFGADYGLTTTKINNYKTDIDNFGYCTILSDLFEEVRTDYVNGMIDSGITSQDATNMFNSIKNVYKALEKVTASLDFLEVLYHYNAYLNAGLDSLENANVEGSEMISAYLPMALKLTNVEFDGNDYTYNFDANIAAFMEDVNAIVQDLRDSYADYVADRTIVNLTAGKYYKVVGSSVQETTYDDWYGTYVEISGKYYIENEWIYRDISDYELTMFDALLELTAVNSGSYNFKDNFVEACKLINIVAGTEYGLVSGNPHYLEESGMTETLLQAIKDLTAVDSLGQYNGLENLTNSKNTITDFLMLYDSELGSALANMLKIESNNGISQTQIFVSNVLSSIRQDEFDLEQTIKDLNTLVDNYSTEDVKSIVAAFAVIGAVYFNEESTNYNEMFEDVILPEGINVDFDKLIEKLKDNKTYDILNISDVEVEYITDKNDKLVKEILTLQLDLNLDASIPAQPGFEEFVVALIDGSIKLQVELELE